MRETHTPLEEDLISKRDAASLFGVSVRTIENWVNDGLIPSIRIGRRRLFLKSALEEHLRQMMEV